jgi:hypothetical protein
LRVVGWIDHAGNREAGSVSKRVTALAKETRTVSAPTF